MTQGVVVVYFGRLGGWLRPHQEVMLEADAKAIAGVKQFEFGGRYRDETVYPGRVYFVPDETLLVEEASSLGINSSDDLYGGVVPQPFVKTKSIAHPLVDDDAVRPDGWSSAFAERVRKVVLRGYSAFRTRDARGGASHVAPGRSAGKGATRYGRQGPDVGRHDRGTRCPARAAGRGRHHQVWHRARRKPAPRHDTKRGLYHG